MDNRYRYKPENGKGDHLRQGADLEKYRSNFDRIFLRPEGLYYTCRFCGRRVDGACPEEFCHRNTESSRCNAGEQG